MGSLCSRVFPPKTISPTLFPGTSGSHRRLRPLQAPALAIAIAAAALLAGSSRASAQDAAAGEKVFVACKACHQVGPTAKNGVGPVLNGLFGRHTGSVDGYSYSPANKAANLTWDEATFTEYIKNPKAKIPGTKMLYVGLKDEQKIKDLIAYLHGFDTAPVSLVAQ
jgi:cytochrome c